MKSFKIRKLYIKIFVRDWGDTCNICQKRYPTEDHLVQHLGNFHCKIDHYLIKKGLRIITKVGIVRDQRKLGNFVVVFFRKIQPN